MNGRLTALLLIVLFVQPTASVRLNQREQFLGTGAWLGFDFLTFGAFEKRHNYTAEALEEQEQRLKAQQIKGESQPEQPAPPPQKPKEEKQPIVIELIQPKQDQQTFVASVRPQPSVVVHSGTTEPYLPLAANATENVTMQEMQITDQNGNTQVVQQMTPSNVAANAQMDGAYEQVATDLFEENQKLKQQIASPDASLLQLHAPLKEQLFKIWKENSKGMGRDFAEEVFRDYGKKAENSETELTKASAWSAVEEILNHWSVALPLYQQSQLKNEVFTHSWNRITSGGTKLLIKDSFALLREMMTPNEVQPQLPVTSVGTSNAQPATEDRSVDIAKRIIERKLKEQQVHDDSSSIELNIANDDKESSATSPVDTDSALKVIQKFGKGDGTSTSASDESTKLEEPAADISQEKVEDQINSIIDKLDE